MVSDRDVYMAHLQRAKENPTSKEVRELLKRVLQYISTTGKAVPWSGEERADEMTKLHAMWRRFGSPSASLNCAPDGVHQPKSMQLGYLAGKSTSWPTPPDGLLRMLRGDAGVDKVHDFCEASVACAADATDRFQSGRNVFTEARHYEPSSDHARLRRDGCGNLHFPRGLAT